MTTLRWSVVWGILCCATSVAAEESLDLPHCLVSLIDDVQAPSEVAGVLVSIAVSEGDQVSVDGPLAQLRDTRPRLEQLVIEAERQVAEARAGNDVNVRYAEASHRVADAEFRMGQAANQRVSGALSASELQRLLLAAEQARLQIEQARHELQIATVEAGAYAAKMQVADEEIALRRIVSPLAGEVVEVYVRPGEWVQPGDPLARIVRMNRLRVEGFVNMADHLPGELIGRSVTVEVELARGRKEQFTGRVTFVSPLVQPGGEYRLWAEVDNRLEADQWLLRPGLDAHMHIEL